eukprot:scaffold1803_cov92-Amphora_coffeaeformis.AAC.15
MAATRSCGSGSPPNKMGGNNSMGMHSRINASRRCCTLSLLLFTPTTNEAERLAKQPAADFRAMGSNCTVDCSSCNTGECSTARGNN